MDGQLATEDADWLSRPPSLMRLSLALVASGAAFGLLVGLMYGSMLLWLSLADLGLPVTIALGIASALRIEQSTLYCVAGWRPRAADLAFSALPAGCLIAVLALWLGAAWLLAIGVGWLMQAPLLRLLASRAGSRSRTFAENACVSISQGR